MATYSLDMREHIVQAIARGIPMTEVARVCGVGYATVKRYKKQSRDTGSLLPKRKSGRPRHMGAPQEQALRAQLEAHPDATLQEHCRIFEREQGVRVSQTTINRAILRLGWTRKKKMVHATERDDAEHARWWLHMQDIEAHRLVFVDECSTNIAMTPLYARSPKGKRAVGTVPSNRGINSTRIASLSLEGIGATMTVDGAADSAIFLAYVRHLLTPTLKPGQAVIMDNIRIHKGDAVREAVAQRGCRLIFLPPYPEGLVPIDEAFSKIKQRLRTAQARTREALDDAIVQACDAVTPADAAGWFKHCGYIR